MTISFILKKSRSTIYVRLRDGRKLDSTMTTGYSVNPLWWDTKREEVKAGIVHSNAEMAELNDKLLDLKRFLNLRYGADKGRMAVDREWLGRALREFAKGRETASGHVVQRPYPFTDTFRKFLNANSFSDGRMNQYHVLERAILRFEEFVRISVPDRCNFSFDVQTVDETTLHDLYAFMSNEHIYYNKYPEIYRKFPEKRQSRPRGANTLSEYFKKLRAFFNWAREEGIIQGSPFSRFKCEKELYGTPYYLTKEELHKVLSTDLSDDPECERQRDVFVFHCCIGCRAGDLLRLRKSDVINGGIEYIATKTIADNARTVRVPLNETALSIIRKHSACSGAKLLPFIALHRYNRFIKAVLTRCGITRCVTVLNPVTRKEEKIPINVVGSSHMARRTFIANIYNKVPDPDIIGSMTGHVEGSRAFARYRTIEEDVKKSLVDILG